jgi:hypothetical protein
LLHGIEPFEFDARISRAELPVDRADSLVAMLLPLLGLLTEILDGGNVVSKALPCQYTQFDLGNIQPTRMLRGVVNFQAVDQGFGLLRRKHFIERGGRVRIQIVHHQDNFLCFRILLSSHIIGELERVCDYLIVLSASRVQLTGDVQELVQEHKRSVGLRQGEEGVAHVHTIIEARHTERQTTLLVRTNGQIFDPS